MKMKILKSSFPNVTNVCFLHGACWELTSWTVNPFRNLSFLLPLP